MPSFALITEGITDQAILETLLESHYDEEGIDVYINVLQPLRDATDESRQAVEHFGGWERVLEFCGVSERILEALALNDYVVIQVDTDCCEHINFGVSYKLDGVDRTVAELICAVQDLLISKIGEDRYQKYSDRFCFAIAVHSSECWLLSLYSTVPAQKRKIVSCEAALVALLARHGEGHNKDYRHYTHLSRRFRKAKDRLAAAKMNESLRVFLTSLPKCA